MAKLRQLWQDFKLLATQRNFYESLGLPLAEKGISAALRRKLSFPSPSRNSAHKVRTKDCCRSGDAPQTPQRQRVAGAVRGLSPRA